MQFIDECKIFVAAGRGGDGSAALRSEPNVPRGGPSGGDGGNGGSVVILADPQLTTLLDLRYQQRYQAEAGVHGMSRDKYGRAGADAIVKVPVGTLVFDVDTDELLCDLVTAGQTYVAAAGGKGGWGNIHFATPTNQTPKAEPGLPGTSRHLRLELKLLADVGLLGYPNVGKSTYIAAVSRARPKIANYPFTTLTPNLGVVGLSGNRSFLLADIPGLIEGASEGAGLGHQFLRHVERCRVLLHLLEQPMSEEDGGDHHARSPMHDFDIINRELAHYDAELAKRPQIVALSKMDVTETQAAYPGWKDAFAARGIHLHAVSAVTGEGMKELLEAVWSALHGQGHKTPHKP